MHQLLLSFSIVAIRVITLVSLWDHFSGARSEASLLPLFSALLFADALSRGMDCKIRSGVEQDDLSSVRNGLTIACFFDVVLLTLEKE